jgi:hypothetical protein
MKISSVSKTWDMSDKPRCLVILPVLEFTWPENLMKKSSFRIYPGRLSIAVIITNPAISHTVVLAKNRNHDYIEASGNEFNRAQILAVR